MRALLLHTFGRWDVNAAKPRTFGRWKGHNVGRNAATAGSRGGSASAHLLKVRRKREDRLLLRKELEGPKDAKPPNRAYTGTVAISLLRKESGKREDQLLLRKE